MKSKRKFVYRSRDPALTLLRHPDLRPSLPTRNPVRRKLTDKLKEQKPHPRTKSPPPRPSDLEWDDVLYLARKGLLVDLRALEQVLQRENQINDRIQDNLRHYPEVARLYHSFQRAGGMTADQFSHYLQTFYAAVSRR